MRSTSATVEEISAIDRVHPYGALPGGNRFFAEVDDDSNSSSHDNSDSNSHSDTQQNKDGQKLCKADTIFADDVWQQILSFCDGATLSNAVQTSRYLYVAGHQLELWRDLVLRYCDKHQLSITHMQSSWKDTYIVMMKAAKANVKDAGKTLPSASSKDTNHKPIMVPGVYSDTLYRSHVCRAFAIPPSWQQISSSSSPRDTKNRNPLEVPRVDAKDMTTSRFATEYESPNLPVIIENAISKERCLDKWKDVKYLQNHVLSSSETTTFRTTSGAAPLPANFTFPAYHQYCTQFDYLEESPLYLFDRTALTTNKCQNECHDFYDTFYERCPYWNPAQIDHDLFQHLGSAQRPDHTWLICGAKRSGSVFHIDPNCTHAWNACIVGRKRWILYPPGITPPGVYPSQDGDEVALPMSVGEWLTLYWKEHLKRCREAPKAERPIECTVGPGDVMFVPHGWWHMVVNLEDDLNIAITHNYVSTSNLGNVLQFLKTKQDQISGCRDREESIKPEHLHEQFVECLQRKYSENKLKRALQQDGWTCDAWHVESKKKARTDGKEQQPTSPKTSMAAQFQANSSFSFSFL